MATVILVRHGRTIANADGILAGRASQVHLDVSGCEQATRVAEQLAVVPLVAVVSSPLERCRQTSQILVEHQTGAPRTEVEPAITECDYGQWQGRRLNELAKEALWSLVQHQPSAAVFPDGESLAAMQARSVAAIRRLDAALEAEHGPGAVWAAVSHGDPIKSVLADALGMHLDLFQRLTIDPGSISIIHYGQQRPQVIRVNMVPGDLSWLRNGLPGAEEEVGGGAGPQTTVEAGVHTPRIH